MAAWRRFHAAPPALRFKCTVRYHAPYGSEANSREPKEGEVTEGNLGSPLFVHRRRTKCVPGGNPWVSLRFVQVDIPF